MFLGTSGSGTSTLPAYLRMYSALRSSISENSGPFLSRLISNTGCLCSKSKGVPLTRVSFSQWPPINLQIYIRTIFQSFNFQTPLAPIIPHPASQIYFYHMNSKTQSDSNSYSESISPFTGPSKPTSKIDRPRLVRIRQRDAKIAKSPEPAFSAELLERDIVAQIEETQRVMDEIYKLLPATKYQSQRAEVQDLRAMQQSLRNKNISIKTIEQEIKLLKNGIFHDSKQTIDNYPKLGQQIKISRECLVKSKNELLNKMKEAYEKKESMRVIQQQFKQKCRQEGIEYLTFQDFKQIQMKKKKQGRKIEKVRKVVSAKKFSYHPQISSMKEIPQRESKGQIRNPQNQFATDSKKMRDLLQKKNLAEATLKKAKKRHKVDITDLMGKLEFLRDQYQDLQEKLAAKNQQLKLAQQKFSESRSSSERRAPQPKYKTDRDM